MSDAQLNPPQGRALGRVLHTQRKRLRLSIDALAAKSGHNRNTIMALERGDGTHDWLTVCNVLQALGLDLGALQARSGATDGH